MSVSSHPPLSLGYNPVPPPETDELKRFEPETTAWYTRSPQDVEQYNALRKEILEKDALYAVKIVADDGWSRSNLAIVDVGQRNKHKLATLRQALNRHDYWRKDVTEKEIHEAIDFQITVKMRECQVRPQNQALRDALNAIRQNHSLATGLMKHEALMAYRDYKSEVEKKKNLEEQRKGQATAMMNSQLARIQAVG
jgi:hypothetical protein